MKLFFSILLLFPMLSQAQTFSNGDEFLVDESRGAKDTSQQGVPQRDDPSQTSQDLTTSGTQTNLSGTGGFTTQGINGVQATNDAQDKGSTVQVLGLAMGAAYTATCVSNPPWTAWACPLAAQSFLDSLAGGSAKNAAYQTGTYIDPTHGNSNFDPNANNSDPMSDVYTTQAQEGLQNLADMGYKVGSDGSIMGPDGRTFTTADYGSAEALAAKGFTPAQIAEIQKGMQNINSAAAKKAGVDLDSLQAQVAGAVAGDALGGAMGGAGGGGYGSTGVDQVIEEVEYVSGDGADGGKNKGRLPANKAAELSTNFNGEPIGISMANLFLIVHKKYKEKKKDQEFIDKEY